MYGTDGTFQGRVATFGDLNSPWGMAMAPGNFGKFSNDLLVGNFGDGRINAFRWSAEDGWEAVGVVKGTDHRPITIDGLWASGSATAPAPGRPTPVRSRPDDETHGLFDRSPCQRPVPPEEAACLTTDGRPSHRPEADPDWCGRPAGRVRRDRVGSPRRGAASSRCPGLSAPARRGPPRTAPAAQP